jgi:hypothetical protein
MFSQNGNPYITQIRRELRGQLPDQWINEVIMILEYQLAYSSVDELDTESLLKLKVGAEKSQALNQGLTQMVQAPPPAPYPRPQPSNPNPFGFLPWNQ